jgi:hypothetical protein
VSLEKLRAIAVETRLIALSRQQLRAEVRRLREIADRQMDDASEARLQLEQVKYDLRLYKERCLELESLRRICAGCDRIEACYEQARCLKE